MRLLRRTLLARRNSRSRASCHPPLVVRQQGAVIAQAHAQLVEAEARVSALEVGMSVAITGFPGCPSA